VKFALFLQEFMVIFITYLSEIAQYVSYILYNSAEKHLYVR